MDLAIFDKVYQHRFEVTEAVYEAFQVCSGDMNPMHVQDEYAQKYGYESHIMYGNILNGFVSYFVGMLLPVQNVVILSQDISYHKPVYLGDVLEFEAKVAHVSDAMNTVEFKYVFKCANGGWRVAKGIVAIKYIGE